LPSFTSGYLPSLPAYMSQRMPKRAADLMEVPWSSGLAAYLQRQGAPLR
jgi:hypothetical protein